VGCVETNAPAGEGEEEYSLRGRSGDLFVAWFRYAIPIGAVPENVTARGLRYAANYTRLRRRFTHAPNGWGQPLNNGQPSNNIVRRLSSIVPVPSLRGASEGSGKRRQAKACRKTAGDSR
jgi:hypothetical protein